MTQSLELARPANHAEVQKEVIGSIVQKTGPLREIELAYEPDIKTLWITITPEPKPVFTLPLLDSLVRVQAAIAELWSAPERYQRAPIRFLAFRGRGPFFTLGGDLDFYLDCLQKNDRQSLAEYARLGAEGAIWNSNCLNGSVITLSTIHDKAMGGGIDAPRSCNVMIAEERATFCYPEVNFNHFPITAIAVLSRKMGQRAAEQLLISGEEVTAAQFMAMGGLEEVVADGTGEAWIRRYCAASLPTHSSRLALFTAFGRRAGDLREELTYLRQIWTDCMLRLTPAEISKLQRIVRAQDAIIARKAKQFAACA